MGVEEVEVKEISAQEFADLDFSKITIVDAREPDEVLIHEIEGALNIPFSKIGTDLNKVSKDKPVYVICRTGDLSEEIAEILLDRGYNATNVLGGYDAYRKVIENTKEDEPVKLQEEEHSTIFIDAKNLRCPGPIVKVADTLRGLSNGSTVEVEATEDAFASDIKVWCERTGNSLDSLVVSEGLIKAKITKSELKQSVSNTAEANNDKTFIVFSGDLDKTIASFIMANGAAAMGRNVTMFFTFWGLNILRSVKKAKVRKTFIEKMFGIMMPRGTKKLGLSRMNMLGAGPKMIRWIMKKKGISSLEQLIDDAKAHGVKIVACQMSMDIMGIRQEELIDGVELGGVATFIGAGEKSDISLFI